MKFKIELMSSGTDSFISIIIKIIHSSQIFFQLHITSNITFFLQCMYVYFLFAFIMFDVNDWIRTL